MHPHWPALAVHDDSLVYNGALAQLPRAGLTSVEATTKTRPLARLETRLDSRDYRLWHAGSAGMPVPLCGSAGPAGQTLLSIEMLPGTVSELRINTSCLF